MRRAAFASSPITALPACQYSQRQAAAKLSFKLNPDERTVPNRRKRSAAVRHVADLSEGATAEYAGINAGQL